MPISPEKGWCFQVKKEKEMIREEIWRILEEENIALFPKPVHGRIPNFKGNIQAALKLRELREYREAETVFCNPDSPQRPVREFVLRDGKKLVMATPRLRKGFLSLNPEEISRKDLRWASTIKGAFKYGVHVHPSKLKIDLKVTGCVAVSLDGGRLGKGHGYSDLEYGLLREYGSISDSTPIATTVHEAQIVPYIPMTLHDMPLDIIITPLRVIRVKDKHKRPKGINWEILSKRKIEEIPLLRNLLEEKNRGKRE